MPPGADYFDFLLSDFAAAPKSHYDFRARQCLSIYDRYRNNGRPQRVLDIGCGAGGLVHSFREHSRIDAFGMEASPQAALHARKQYGDFFFEHTLGEAISPQEQRRYGQYDFITAFEVFQMFSYVDYPKYLKQVSDLLAEGGLFLMMIPNFSHPYLFPYLAYSDPYTKSMVTPESLYRICRADPTLRLLKIIRWNSASKSYIVWIRTLLQKTAEFLLSKATPFFFQTSKRLDPQIQTADLFLSSHMAAIFSKKTTAASGGLYASHN